MFILLFRLQAEEAKFLASKRKFKIINSINSKLNVTIKIESNRRVNNSIDHSIINFYPKESLNFGLISKVT